jgi:archaellum component FlaC
VCSSDLHVYAAVFLVLLQLVVIPLTAFFWKAHSKKLDETQKLQKEIIDRETRLRKQERDAEIKEMNNRINAIEKDTKHMIDGLIDSQNRTADTLQRLFNRFDDLVKRVEDLSLFMHVQKQTSRAKRA